MTTNKKRPRDFLSLVNVREELQPSGMRIDPSGAMGRRWSGVERVWALLRARSFQRAHHDGGSMIVGWRVAGLRALEFVPFGAHIGSGCKEAPTCLY